MRAQKFAVLYAEVVKFWSNFKIFEIFFFLGGQTGGKEIFFGVGNAPTPVALCSWYL